ncbi:MAG: hypothetical protein OXG51_12990 [Gammaproteobacteria bacterium]|nr:hypothetical protein [Gammaproteobacteria bacterium]
MSDGWFDRSYRSNETPPAELDARVLAAARRATRRWTLPALAAGALIAAAVLILGLLVTGHQLHVPVGDRASSDSSPDSDALEVNIARPPGRTDATNALPHHHLTEPLVEPSGNPGSSPATDGTAVQAPVARVPEFDCVRSALIGSLGGAGRRDLVQICAGDDKVRIEIVWDGEPSCPSTLEVDAPAQSATVLDSADLLIAGVRYRCADGQWSRVENPAPG